MTADVCSFDGSWANVATLFTVTDGLLSITCKPVVEFPIVWDSTCAGIPIEGLAKSS